jgi:hypothetical protein
VINWCERTQIHGCIFAQLIKTTRRSCGSFNEVGDPHLWSAESWASFGSVPAMGHWLIYVDGEPPGLLTLPGLPGPYQRAPPPLALVATSHQSSTRRRRTSGPPSSAEATRHRHVHGLSLAAWVGPAPVTTTLSRVMLAVRGQRGMADY